MTVVSSRCPGVFTRRTQKPFSPLWKVTRSIRPEISSIAGFRSGLASFMCGNLFSHQVGLEETTTARKRPLRSSTRHQSDASGNR